jgi:putative addiction module killer protein
MRLQKTNEFLAWLKNLKDIRAKARIARRLDRLSLDNPGDIRVVGDGVSELRIDEGPGYRIYLVIKGPEAILLWGGDKSTQSRDIARAKRMLREIDDDD